jgi:hypothetical protein
LTVKREHLSFDEQIIVAYAHYVRGVEQQVLTAIFCTNSGRVSEACTAIKGALDKVKSRPSDREESYGKHPARYCQRSD